MNFNISPPPSFQGTNGMAQLHSYLYQLQQQLQFALEQIDTETIAQEVTDTIIGGTIPDGAGNTLNGAYSTLKSIIIKTAQTVQSNMDKVVATFNSDYVAKSDFGTYQEEIERTVEDTSYGTLTTYNVLTNISGLTAYKNLTESYIRQGIIGFDDLGDPITGIVIGENLSITEVEGVEVINLSGKNVTITPDKMSFNDGDVEVAYYAGSTLVVNQARFNENIQVGNWVIDTSRGFAIKWAGGEA